MVDCADIKKVDNAPNKIGKSREKTYSKFMNGMFGNIPKMYAFTQIGMGMTAGWATGFSIMTRGILPGLLVGASALSLKWAYERGLLKMEGGAIIKFPEDDKVEIFQADEEIPWNEMPEPASGDLTLPEVRAWCLKYIGEQQRPKINGIQIFMTAFAGGMVLGLITA